MENEIGIYSPFPPTTMCQVLETQNDQGGGPQGDWDYNTHIPALLLVCGHDGDFRDK